MHMPSTTQCALAFTIAGAAVLAILYRRRCRAVGHVESAPEGSSAVASFTVGASASLGDLLCSHLPREFPSRGFVKRSLKRGQILVDGSPAESESVVLRPKQRVAYVMSRRPRVHQARTGPPPSLQLEWAHVDEHMAVCVKPHGVAVQSDESAKRLKHAVGWSLPPSHERPDALAVAQPVRLLLPTTPTDCSYYSHHSSYS